jgi:hypothetical protein
MQRSLEQHRQDTTSAPAGSAGVPLAARPVRVIAGADVQDLDLAGRTVAQARVVARALFGVGDDAVALIDGQRAEEQQALGEGQLLEFVKHSGQKGALLRATRKAVGPVIEVAGERAIWRRNGRRLGMMSVTDLLGRIETVGPAPQRWRLYPHHVRLMVERRGGEVMGVVIEMPPGPRLVHWIADDSPHAFGEDAHYEPRRLSFPWVVLVIVFAGGDLSGVQQAFYRNAPISSLADDLCYTNLLNVARGYDQESWVCLAQLRRRLADLTWEQRVTAVTEHFWQAAFTRSSEVHEGNSHWGSLKELDVRVSSAAAWEVATQASPYFTLEVPWPRTGHTLAATLERMLDMVAAYRPIERAEQLVTLMQAAE